MGEWHPAEFAYMVYTDENGVMEGNPRQPTIPAIYKIFAKDVAKFKRENNIWGAKWVAIYELQDKTKTRPLKESNAETDSGTAEEV